MKLSELSRRDYIALEVLPAIVARGEKSSPVQVRSAYDVADAMLSQMGIHDHEIATLTARAEKAENTVSVLINMDTEFAPRVALLQIWEFLDVKDQTGAMQALAMLRREAGL